LLLQTFIGKLFCFIEQNDKEIVSYIETRAGDKWRRAYLLTECIQAAGVETIACMAIATPIAVAAFLSSTRDRMQRRLGRLKLLAEVSEMRRPAIIYNAAARPPRGL